MNKVNHIVGVADMKISARPGELITTYALGSCLGIAIHDPVAQVGGLLHVMLPDSNLDPEKAKENPAKFVDTGLPRLFIETYKAGARKERLIVKVAGGAAARQNEEEDQFQIGKRNFIALRRILWKNGILIKSYDVGGAEPRTMTLEVGNGAVAVKASGEMRFL